MNNETHSAEIKTETPPLIELTRSFILEANARQTLVRWLKRLFACNPFYLVSAALLLFGMYRISIDTAFLPTEVGRLTFNFSSLQFYELLLVGVAIVLAGRAIWYDARLLLVLENLLWLVPFILISQAALIEQRTVWVLSLATALLAAMRFGLARRWMFELKLPPRLLTSGLAVLALNTALPICYRTFNQTKFGAWPTWGAAYHMNQLTWLLLLPLVCALVNVLPRVRKPQSAERRWFPLGIYMLWLVGTGVHLYCLDYVYEFKLSRALFAPALWVLAWTFYRRQTDFISEPTRDQRLTTLLLPIIAAFVAVGSGSNSVFFVLNLLNAVAFAGIVLAGRDNRVALHLALISIAAVVAGVPHEWTHAVLFEFSRGKFVVVPGLAYLILGTALSRSPKLAVLGAFAAAAAGGLLPEANGAAGHWAVQAGLVFLLLHSLRWRDFEHEGAAAVRVLAGIVWVAHSFIWVRCGAEYFQPLLVGAVVLAIWWARWFVFRNRSAVIVPIASVLVATCSPIDAALVGLQTVPVGVIVICASFLLFGLGTIAALTRHRWLREEER